MFSLFLLLPPLGTSWGQVKRGMRINGSTWAPLGAILAPLGAISAQLVAILAQLCGILVQLGAVFAQLGAIFAPLGAVSVRLGAALAQLIPLIPLYVIARSDLRAILPQTMPTRFRLHRNGSSLSGSSMECRVLMELGRDSGNGDNTTQGGPKRSP